MVEISKYSKYLKYNCLSAAGPTRDGKHVVSGKIAVRKQSKTPETVLKAHIPNPEAERSELPPPTCSGLVCDWGPFWARVLG